MVNSGALRISAWCEQLPADDEQRDFLLDGIAKGFNILNISLAQKNVDAVEVDNYKSATSAEVRDLVEEQILSEIANNRYKIVSEKPLIVSALGAVRKGDGGVRLIHDASRPQGRAVNDYWEKEPFSYQSLQDAVDLFTPHCYAAKLDMEKAFRTVPTHPSNYPYMGLKWKFKHHSQDTYMVDTRLPFGARRSPYIFHQLGQAALRIMAAKGYHNIVVFLDDFLVVHEDREFCLQTLNVLLLTLRELGFSINYNKVVMPTKRITFLGIDLDSRSMTIELPRKKIDETLLLLQAMQTKKKVTKKELQSVVGKLNFACQCVYGGKFFLRRLYDAINKLQQAWHRTRVTRNMLMDIHWWLQFLTDFPGWLPMIDPRPLCPIYTDACGLAAGAAFGHYFVYMPWSHWEGCEDLHINSKEAIAVEIAVTHWAPHLAHHKVLVHSDNQAAVSMLNRGSSRCPRVMRSLRNIYWLSAKYNFRIQATYIPGRNNTLADTASRLHEPDILERNHLDVSFSPIQITENATSSWFENSNYIKKLAGDPELLNF